MSHFEIFILNYNGAKFLNDCLLSLKSINAQNHRVGINVVDNGSTDNSKEIVNLISDVNYIELGKNYGFSKGNNLGVQKRIKQLGFKPDYLMFLNNDTKVDANLINAIDKTFNTNPKAAMVGVKSLFMDDFIPVSFDIIDNYLDVKVVGDNIGTDAMRYRPFKGYYLKDNTWRIKKGGCLFVPVRDKNLKSSIKLSSAGYGLLRTLKSFYRDGNVFKKDFLPSGDFLVNQYFDFAPENYIKLIQNAGSFVTKRFEAGDMGSFEIDTGQYDQDRELSAVCGVAMAIKTDLFNKLDGFDPHFFAYYEDTDLSLRVKREGYECCYSAAALIHHVHAGSSGVATNYFKYNVTYSRLYFLSKFAPSALYQKRVGEIKASSAREFELYMHDGVSENKPNLRSYAKYLKYKLKFLFNRLLRFVNKNADEKIGRDFLEEKYVNEF